MPRSLTKYTSLLIPFFLSTSLGCSERSLIDSPSEDQGPQSNASSRSCETAGDCELLQYCAKHESGSFCTDGCEEKSECPNSINQDTLRCISLGTEEISQVCAWDCSGDSACPPGMNCSAVASPSGDMNICFFN